MTVLELQSSERTVDLLHPPFSLMELNDYQVRTLQVLEHAEELLCHYGYTKVTVEDIATKAQVGKGTIYLHFRSKDDLFYALFAKASAELTCEMVLDLEKDKDLVRFDAFICRFYSLCQKRELVAALFKQDAKLLGKLARHKARTASEQLKLESLKKSLEMYRGYQLVRSDVDLETQVHSLSMILLGSFTYTSWVATSLSSKDPLAVLRNVLRNTFIPEQRVDVPQELYAYVETSLQKMICFYRDNLFQLTVKHS